MVPEWRPSSPLSTGPTLFFAVGPTSWHGAHFLNEVAPALRSCAIARPAEIAVINVAIRSLFSIANGPSAGFDLDRVLRACEINGGACRAPCAGAHRASRNGARTRRPAAAPDRRR